MHGKVLIGLDLQDFIYISLAQILRLKPPCHSLQGIQIYEQTLPG